MNKSECNQREAEANPFKVIHNLSESAAKDPCSVSA
jgi:hypothetical protein